MDIRPNQALSKDTVAELLVRSTNSRKSSGMGRKAQRIRVDSLSDAEFDKAQELLWGRKLMVMKGGEVAEEYRSPWGAPSCCRNGAACGFVPAA
jgi:hypothetical protein